MSDHFFPCCGGESNVRSPKSKVGVPSGERKEAFSPPGDVERVMLRSRTVASAVFTYPIKPDRGLPFAQSPIEIL
jgi:hypothetical protein